LAPSLPPQPPETTVSPGAVRHLRAALSPSRLVLLAILGGALAVRVVNNDYGLPFIWSVDEATHFTNRAVAMLRTGLDPDYYQNPAAYTYLVYFALRAMYGPLGFLFDLRWGNVTRQFGKDPTEVWITARTAAAALGVVGVATTYAAARRLWGVREGLVGAAVLGFAFLPVAYSRVAVTDVGSLVGVSLAVWASVRVSERGRLRDYAAAGAAAGLALGFKYTAGLALLPLLVAAVGRVRRDGLRVIVGLAAGVAAAAAVFAATNPYVIPNLDSYWEQVTAQADVAANERKVGATATAPIYYLESLTWGLGWAAAGAALVGAIWELRRSLLRGLVIVAFPLALFAYLSLQARYFGRWLLPAYPVLAMLVAIALVRASDAVTRNRVWGAAALVAATVAVLAQPLTADIRTAIVLGRDDTRIQARRYLVEHFPPEMRVAIEPAVPARYYRVNPDGRLPAWLGRCARRQAWTEPGWSYPGADGRRVCRRFRPGQFARPDERVRASSYYVIVSPEVVDDLRFYGYCHVVTLDVVRERALKSGGGPARAYYRRLARESDLLRTFSPYDRGAKPVPFNFDLSYNYYPLAYQRPGPVVRIYRLKRCEQRYGPSLVPVPRARELDPFTRPRDVTPDADGS
jgi:hypothetical protein